ncbi:MAG TPA: cytidylate kinase family protein [Candidatus Paceibacterota bacterium]|jgi:cytidylate kinase|nr:cytidylate kinase family protein [Candidatus Paceibacterota bacterium]
MGKKTIITIAGDLGSGKSSNADKAASLLGYSRFSSGDFARLVAKRHGMSIEELNEHAEEHPEIDHEIDDEVKAAGEREKLVIDSRTAFHWIPDSFKVYLKLDPKLAAARIYEQMLQGQRVSQHADSVDHMYEQTIRRKESERKRYLALYGFDSTDPSGFDLVIDTATAPLEKVSEKIIEEYKKWLGSNE